MTTVRRIVLWALSTLSVVVLLFGYSTSTSGPAGTTATTVFVSGTSAGTSTSSSSSSSSSSSATPGSTSSSSGATTGSTPTTSATVTGEVAQTRWGPVQVELTMSGTAITVVRVLEYPSGNPKDEEINSYALPILIQETTDAQSADIDVVSGATYTSEGYLQSLQSALDQAGA